MIFVVQDRQLVMMQHYKKSKSRLLIFGLVDCVLSFRSFSTGGMIVSNPCHPHCMFGWLYVQAEDTYEAVRLLAEDKNNTVCVNFPLSLL